MGLQISGPAGLFSLRQLGGGGGNIELVSFFAAGGAIAASLGFTVFKFELSCTSCSCPGCFEFHCRFFVSFSVDKVSKVGAGVGATGGSLSRQAVETGIGVTEELLRRSVTGGTWAAYSSVWGEWSDLVSSVGRNVSQQEYLALLLYFIGNGFAQGTSVSKINKSLAALAFFFRSQGLTDVTKDFRVRQAMKGFRRGRWWGCCQGFVLLIMR